jgi:hypothetical protein
MTIGWFVVICLGAAYLAVNALWIYAICRAAAKADEALGYKDEEDGC